MIKKIKNKRYGDLIDIINRHNLLYHTYDSPEIPDHEYDKLYQELKEIEESNPSIVVDYSPTQRVGSNLLENFDKRNHEVPVPDFLITGSSGNTREGQLVTFSGGARG